MLFKEPAFKECLLCAKGPLAMPVLLILGRSRVGTPFRSAGSQHSAPQQGPHCLPPWSEQLGGTRCSGRIQRDAICQGNLFLESRDSRWRSWPTPSGSGGMWGGQAAKALPSAGGQDRLKAGSTQFSGPRFLLCLNTIRNNSKHLPSAYFLCHI